MHAPQPSKTKRWMILLAIVIIVSIIGITLSYVIGQEKTDEAVHPQSQGLSSQPVSSISEANLQPVAATMTAEIPATSSSNAIVNDSLLAAPMPQDQALAQEEMDRLKDQQSQLLDQKALLQQQLKDSSQLIELKQKLLADMQNQLDKTAV